RELGEAELLVGVADVPGGEDGALDHVHVSPRLLDQLSALGRSLGGAGGGAENTRLLDLPDAALDQLGLDRLLVDLLEERDNLSLVRGADPLDHGLRVLVPSLDPVQV